LTTDILSKVAGKVLVCVGTSSNLWGSATDYESNQISSKVLEYVSGPKTITKNWYVNTTSNVFGSNANIRFNVNARDSFGTIDNDSRLITSFTFQITRKNQATGVSELVGTRTFNSFPPDWTIQFTYSAGENAWSDNLSSSGSRLKWSIDAMYLLEIRAEFKKFSDWNTYLINPAKESFKVGGP
jgi:hypothetical protein